MRLPPLSIIKGKQKDSGKDAILCSYLILNFRREYRNRVKPGICASLTDSYHHCTLLHVTRVNTIVFFIYMHCTQCLCLLSSACAEKKNRMVVVYMTGIGLWMWLQWVLLNKIVTMVKLLVCNTVLYNKWIETKCVPKYMLTCKR